MQASSELQDYDFEDNSRCTRNKDFYSPTLCIPDREQFIAYICTDVILFVQSDLSSDDEFENIVKFYHAAL